VPIFLEDVYDLPIFAAVLREAYNNTMTIHIHATYRDGAIHPDHPLGLPDNTEVNVVVVPLIQAIDASSGEKTNTDASLPEAPRFTSAELRERLAKSAVRVGSLPEDFSREDIYSDHD
jgi:hypothetical protein